MRLGLGVRLDLEKGGLVSEVEGGALVPLPLCLRGRRCRRPHQQERHEGEGAYREGETHGSRASE